MLGTPPGIPLGGILGRSGASTDGAAGGPEVINEEPGRKSAKDNTFRDN